MIFQSRRSFITGLAALVAAPAVVRASSLMPVKAPKQLLTDDERLKQIIHMFEESNKYMNDLMERQIVDSIFYGSAQWEVKSGLSGLLARPISQRELYLGS